MYDYHYDDAIDWIMNQASYHYLLIFLGSMNKAGDILFAYRISFETKDFVAFYRD